MSGPDYIQFYPTTRCNEACGFCFNRGVPDMPDLPLADFRRMLGILRTAGTRTIDIMGGEPTLHPDLPAMVAEAEGFGFSVNISSNGADLDMLDRIISAASRTTVGLSVNDADTLERLAPFIQLRRPVVKTVYSSGLDPALIRAVLALRPMGYFLLYRDAMDRAEPDASLPFDRFRSEVAERYRDTVGTVFCSGFLPDTGRYPGLASVRCPAGTTKLGILPDGSVYPCNLFFGAPALRLGNILSDPFGTIWSSGLLDFFRADTPNTCPHSSCELHASCRGGCPAHGLAHHNDLAASDVRCSRR